MLTSWRLGAVLVWVVFALSAPADAATYWLSPTGAASWASCVGATPLSGTAACTLYDANNNAVAGDLIYLRGGTYTQTSADGCGNNYWCGIDPKNSGTVGARITYSAYAAETPVLTGTAGYTLSHGIAIHIGTGNGTNVGTFIRVTGITFHNLYKWADLYNYASYNEIDHNTFYSDTGDDFGDAAGLAINSFCYGGPSWQCYSKHNWIHHNTFSKAHQDGTTACIEGADMIRIGIGYSSGRDNNASTVQDDYNTVEDNTIAYAGHAIMDTYGGYSVISRNFMHNEGWITDTSGGTCSFPPMPNGKYGHRELQTTEDYARAHQYVLVEGNRFGFSAANPGNPGDANYAITSPSTIVRYNTAFGGAQVGIGTKWYSAFTDHTDALANRGAGGTGPYNIRIYNNTTYWNGQTYPYMQAAQTGCTTCPGKLAGINVYGGALDVIVTNNIAYDNFSYGLYGYDITVNTGQNPASYPGVITETNNWKTSNGNPLFTNTSVADPTSATLPDLTLQSSSGAIDQGTSLTLANGAGSSSTTLIVDDAMFFQDGTWGSDLARGVTLFPDWIAIGTVGNTAQVTAINYTTNTITLAAAKTWSDNAPIWLYKKSDGVVILNGTAPDMGASESGSTPRKWWFRIKPGDD